MLENSEEKANDSHYKIQCGKTYYVRRKDVKYEGGTIANYVIPVGKKINNKLVYFNKKVRFKQGVSLKDNTQIVIKNFFEDVYENKKDNLNPIWHLFILDFEIVEEPDDLNSDIINYQRNIDNIKVENEREDIDLITF